MDANVKAANMSEISISEKKSANYDEVVVLISNKETPKASISRDLNGSSPKNWDYSSTPKHYSLADSVLNKVSAPMSCPSPESAQFSSSPRKPPKVPMTETLVRRRSFTRSLYSKPKSRFGEQPYPIDLNAFDEDKSMSMRERDMGSANFSYRNTSNQASPGSKVTSRTISITLASRGAVGVDEDEEIYRKVTSSKEKHKGSVKSKVLAEWAVFVFILGCLVASLTVHKLEKSIIWGLEIWKWCVLTMVIFCGMLLTNWFMHLIVFCIERNFLLRKKVLYFVHGLKKSVQIFIWLALILLTWVLLFNRGVERSASAMKILNCVTWTILSFLIGAFLGLIKTLLLKILASSFHVNTFFDRIQESIFHQYVLQTLSSHPLMEIAERVGRVPGSSQLSFTSTTNQGKEGKDKDVINMEKLHNLKQEKVSAGTMKVLVDVIASSMLSTISNTLDESVNEGGDRTDREITNEMEAIAAAYHIFRNVAQPGCSDIDEEDLMRFMIKEEVDLVFPLFEGAETGRINRKALTDWVVKVYNGRKALAHALNDTKTAVKQLNTLITGILVVVVIIIWLLLMEIATTKVLVFLLSQLVVAAFMFGNTCKTLFEAIIFVFVMHPFDVGDRCVIDGIQMVVEEMNILTTIFLRYDNEKIYYPNSVLATKPISNFYRSPDMGDNVDFAIDFMTPAERIGALKERIKKYLEKNPQHWHPNHNLAVKEIENVNKIKMALYFNHTINFQDIGEKITRKSGLVMELKKIFEDLGIKYNRLPQKVILSDNMGSATSGTTR